MSEWFIHNDEIWVLAEKVKPDGSRIIFESGKDRPNLTTTEVNGELGLLIFSTREWAEKFLRDSGLQDMEPVKLDYLLTWLRELKGLFPKLTYLVLEPIGGHINVKIAPIEDILRNHPS